MSANGRGGREARPPVVLTRREFLEMTSAAAAAVVAGAAVGGCTDESAAPGPTSTTAPPTSAAPTSTPGTTTSTSELATTTSEPVDPLADVVAVAVHPAIGIARVGNSLDSFYFGPEQPQSLPIAPAGFKDAAGAVARQAARFRIYGYDAGGEVVAEITAADADITWTVHVANKKAAWYVFDRAMDLPVAEPVRRRNPDEADRARLVVDPGERSIGGAAAGPVALDGGTFLGEPVGLGELLTDEHGRLVVLPGEGRGYSPGQAPLTSFANNDGWTDDTCDGPITASVMIGGRTMAATPGWIVVAPPNYGPGVRAGLVSAYDSARLGWESVVGDPSTAAEVSFRDDVLPILSRIVDMQWVNAGYFDANGWGSGADYLDPDLLARLADPGPASATLRREIFERFRTPDLSVDQPVGEPQMWGDGVAFPARSSYQWLAVTPTQYAALAAWSAGTFDDDLDRSDPQDFDALGAAEQVRALDRAPLDACLGGAYHPGVEVPWALRVPSVWAAPARLRVRSTAVDIGDEGDVLTPERTMAVDGPLAGSGPGDLTRWMSAPWHADAASCRSGNQAEISPVLPTFWPARVPNHVLRHDDYLVVVDEGAPLTARAAAFGRRYDWQRFVAASNRPDTLRNMVDNWAAMGLVTEQPGPSDGAFPAVMLVETDVGFDVEPVTTWNPQFREIDPLVWDAGPDTTSS